MVHLRVCLILRCDGMLIFLKELLENTNETVINIRIYFFYFSNRKLISGVEFSGIDLHSKRILYS